MLMFSPVQLKRKESDILMIRTNIGGYRIDCHMTVELRMLLRPKARNITSGEALINASTTLLCKPAGDMAGARAMKTSTLSFSMGWTDRAAKA